MRPVLGIDVAKAKCDLALECPDGKVRHKSVPNTAAGHADLLAWVGRQVAGAVHACLEATGVYGDAVALALADAGHTVSIVNPLAISAYAQSELRRAKTDRTDSDVILRYCRAQRPPAWVPPAPEIRTLQALVRRIVAVDQMRQQELNRLEAHPTQDVVRESITAVLAELTSELEHLKHLVRDHIDRHPDLRGRRDLLTTIPGIGDTTAITLLAELFGPMPYLSVKQAVATARNRAGGQAIGQLGPWARSALFPGLPALAQSPLLSRPGCHPVQPGHRRDGQTPRGSGQVQDGDRRRRHAAAPSPRVRRPEIESTL